MDLNAKISAWLLTGEVGLSSKAICCAALGLPGEERWSGHNNYYNYPGDPSDFRRCFLLLEAVPEVREPAFAVLSKAHEPWPELVAGWDEITALFLAEWGPNRDGEEAPKTYALMKRIILGKRAA